MRSAVCLPGTIGRGLLAAVTGALIWLTGGPAALATPPPAAPDPLAFESITESLPAPADHEPGEMLPPPDPAALREMLREEVRR